MTGGAATAGAAYTGGAAMVVTGGDAYTGGAAMVVTGGDAYTGGAAMVVTGGDAYTGAAFLIVTAVTGEAVGAPAAAANSDLVITPQQIKKGAI
eukprot:1166248-Amphidinium_carterae.1